MAKNKKNRKSITGKNRTTKRVQSASNVPTANRTYKDTVFRMLFSDRENLLSLYNAINGTTYEDPGALEIVTLENAIYMRICAVCIKSTQIHKRYGTGCSCKMRSG